MYLKKDYIIIIWEYLSLILTRQRINFFIYITK